MNRQAWIWWSLLLLSLLLAGCGGGATPTPIIVVITPPPPQSGAATDIAQSPSPQPELTPEVPQLPSGGTGIEILEATFAHGLSEEMQPLDPGADFGPDATVYLSLRIKGRPEEGVVTARFYWHDTLIAEAGIDLADLNSGLIFSVGEDTFAGYTLTHDQSFPLSDGYRAEVFYDDQALGPYPFRVVPPPEAIPSQVKHVTLALDADENYDPVQPTNRFSADQTVHLVGKGDLGLATWLQADWFIAGELDEEGTRSLTMEENAPDTGFAFSFLPEGGWPSGEHFVVLTMNDQEVGRYTFSVIPSSSTDGDADAPDEAAFWDSFPLPDDAELVPVVEGFDYGFATSMTEPEVFDAYAAWLEEQGWQRQAPTEAMVTLPHQLWRKDGSQFLIEIEGLDEQDRTIVWVQFTAADS